jgi:hypothetical protein
MWILPGVLNNNDRKLRDATISKEGSHDFSHSNTDIVGLVFSMGSYLVIEGLWGMLSLYWCLLVVIVAVLMLVRQWEMHEAIRLYKKVPG